MTAPETGANAPDLSSTSNEELADAITLLAAHIQAATCRLLMLIAEMDRREAYGELHFKSCAHWLSWRTGDSTSTAREKVRVARKLKACPQVLQAFAEGRISYSKVRAITRIVTPDNEETLLAYALDGSTSQLERIIRCYRGPTDVDNLTLLCSFHHRAVHEGGFEVDRLEDGALSFRTPAGFQLQPQPEAVVLEDNPVEAMVAEHEAMALAIAAENGRPGWDGITPVDYAGAVNWLLELGPSP